MAKPEGLRVGGAGTADNTQIKKLKKQGWFVSILLYKAKMQSLGEKFDFTNLFMQPISLHCKIEIFDFSINIHIMGRNIPVYQFISVWLQHLRQVMILLVNFCLMQEACSGLFNCTFEDIYTSATQERMQGETKSQPAHQAIKILSFWYFSSLGVH